eukprot:gene154-181_t
MDNDKLTDYEAALYDRGIRVWGVDAQNRLRKSRVLFVGLSGQSAEVCKNVALAGVGGISVLDHHIVTRSDLSLFTTDDSLGKERGDESVIAIRDLNPLVNVTAESRSIDTIDDEFIKVFSVVCLDSMDATVQLNLNQLCRRNNISFFLTHSFGMNSYFFSDLGSKFEHTVKRVIHARVEGDKEITPEQVFVDNKVAVFSSLNDSLSVNWTSMNRTTPAYFVIAVLYIFHQKYNRVPTPKDIDDLVKILEDTNKQYNVSPTDKHVAKLRLMVRQLNNEIAPVCGIVGGIVGQEIIKIISRDTEPLNNFFFYDGLDGTGLVESIHPSK